MGFKIREGESEMSASTSIKRCGIFKLVDQQEQGIDMNVMCIEKGYF